MKKVALYILSTVTVIIVFYGSLEFTTRTISWFLGKGFTLSMGERDIYDNERETLYQFHPSTGFIFTPYKKFSAYHPYRNIRTDTQIDQHGFLSNGRSIEFQKLKNEIRIACIGASTTANIGLTYEENWPGYLEQLLQEARPDKTIRVINAAVPGFDTSQSIPNLALRVMPFQPDIVIIYNAYNDLKAIRKNRTFKPDYSHIHRTPYGFNKKPPFFMQLLYKSMFFIRTREEYRLLTQLPPKHTIKSVQTNENRLQTIPKQAVQTFESHMQSLIAIAKAGGAKVVLSSFASLHDPDLNYSQKDTLNNLTTRQKKELRAIQSFTPGLTLEGIFSGLNVYNKLLEGIANSENIGWVDSANLIPHKDNYFLDRVHFNVKGSKAMAENFYPVILNLLSSL